MSIIYPEPVLIVKLLDHLHQKNLCIYLHTFCKHKDSNFIYTLVVNVLKSISCTINSIETINFENYKRRTIYKTIVIKD